MIGSYGNRCANMGVANADLLIALGTRLDTRQTGARLDQFLSNGHIIHVDIDDNELEYHRLLNRKKVNCTEGKRNAGFFRGHFRVEFFPAWAQATIWSGCRNRAFC